MTINNDSSLPHDQGAYYSIVRRRALCRRVVSSNRGRRRSTRRQPPQLQQPVPRQPPTPPARRSSSPASAANMARKTTSTATKTNTDIRNIPQALTVISEKQIEDQSTALGRRIADFRSRRDARHRREQPRPDHASRQQHAPPTSSSTASATTSQYFRDFYNVDRVEVLKGPNAMIFGRGGGGGIVNRVTQAREPSATIARR